jgi:hypothetical protein
MTAVQRMRSTDRGFSWFAAVWGVPATFTPIYTLRSGVIRAYVRIDQQGASSP